MTKRVYAMSSAKKDYVREGVWAGKYAEKHGGKMNYDFKKKRYYAEIPSPQEAPSAQTASTSSAKSAAARPSSTRQETVVKKPTRMEALRAKRAAGKAPPLGSRRATPRVSSARATPRAPARQRIIPMKPSVPIARPTRPSPRAPARQMAPKPPRRYR